MQEKLVKEQQLSDARAVRAKEGGFLGQILVQQKAVRQEDISHVLVKHCEEILHDCPRTFDALREYLSDGAIEVVVWHHPDGRIVKTKRTDCGINTKPANSEWKGAS